jgi:type II secretory pathway pseudopilin PulG
MIVVATIAVLSAVAMPSLKRARTRSQTAALVNEIRTTADAFQMYITENNAFPPSAAGFSAIPAGMTRYMPKKSTWTSATLDGSRWYWWKFAPAKIWGFSGLIGLYNPRFSSEVQNEIDRTFDDGNPSIGNIRISGYWVFVGVN